LPRSWSGVSEEITASLLGSLVVEDEQDQQALILKALFEAVKQGLESEYAAKLLLELRLLLEKLL
ncbi:MAG TPA: hypothetical protein VFA26_14140, partial [Gemmataceae bacterium]|nr:hypothetical protein [Gemmataceae bacterium]